MTELVFRSDAYAKSCAAVVTASAPGAIQLDRTVFYPTGGGQPGDIGTLTLADGTAIKIVDARKGAGPDEVVHVPAEGSQLPAPGTKVTAAIDWDRRYRHMRMHTALHLLCNLVTGSVTGGQIGADKSRLDFDVPSGALDKDALTQGLNALIAADHPVSASHITDAELAANPDMVRTMSVKPPMGAGTVRVMEIPGVDRQPCGGTHVARTGEIGAVEVAKIENKGKQNRRIVVTLKS